MIGAIGYDTEEKCDNMDDRTDSEEKWDDRDDRRR